MKNVIDSYYKLPIGKYIEILDLCEDDNLEDIDRQVEINAILADITPDEALHLPLTEFEEITRISHFLDEECPESRRGIPKTYKLEGMELEAKTDIAKITTAQYIDFKNLCEDRRHHLPEILSCFLVPKGMEYDDGYDITEIHRLLREHLSVADAMTLTAFFLRRYLNLMAASLIYCRSLTRKIKDKEKRKEMRSQIKELLTSLAANGGGLTASAEYPRPRTNLGRLFGR